MNAAPPTEAGLFRKICQTNLIERKGLEMEEESAESVASNFIWAIALIVVVMIIVGALYYGGVFNNQKRSEIDVDVSVPSR